MTGHMRSLRQAIMRAASIAAGAVLVTTAASAGDASTDGLSLSIGGVAAIAPKYEGSRDYRVMGFPLVVPSFGGNGTFGRVEFKGIDDIRYRLVDADGFEAGPLLGWRFGREEDDGDLLRGLGDIDGGLVAGGYVAYRMGLIRPFISYHHQVTGDDTGGLVRFGAEARTNLSRNIELVGTVGATYATQAYMDAFFSVTPAQSAASVAGLPVFDADAGIKDIYVGLNATMPLSESWTLRLGAKYSHLVGDAADSPVVETSSQWSGGIGLTWKLPAR